MSHNQSRPEKREAFQYRKSSGRSNNYSQQKAVPSANTSTGKGGGSGGPVASGPPPINSTAPQLTSNRSYKKTSNNEQETKFRPFTAKSPEAAQDPQNGIPGQASSSHGASDSTVTSKPSAASTQKAPQPYPRSSANSAGGKSKASPFQFGSVTPGLMNGMQIPARTNSAPPNLDDQKQVQARISSHKNPQAAAVPVPPKQQSSLAPKQNHPSSARKEQQEQQQQQPSVESSSQMSTGKETQGSSSVSAAPLPTARSQKPPVHNTLPMPSTHIPFQPQPGPLSFGLVNSNAQGTSVPISMPIPMGSVSQVQQHVLVPSRQHHTAQPSVMASHGQSMNFATGPPMNPQMTNPATSIPLQYAQQKCRKSVQIKDPVTKLEVKFDNGTAETTYADGGISNTRMRSGAPFRSQPPPFVPSYFSAYNPAVYASFPGVGANYEIPTAPPSYRIPMTGSEPPRVVTIKPSPFNAGEKDKAGVSLSAADPGIKNEPHKAPRVGDITALVTQKRPKPCLPQVAHQHLKPNHEASLPITPPPTESPSLLPSNTSDSREEDAGKSGFSHDHGKKPIDETIKKTDGSDPFVSAPISPTPNREIESSSIDFKCKDLKTDELANANGDTTEATNNGEPDDSNHSDNALTKNEEGTVKSVQTPPLDSQNSSASEINIEATNNGDGDYDNDDNAAVTTVEGFQISNTGEEEEEGTVPAPPSSETPEKKMIGLEEPSVKTDEQRPLITVNGTAEGTMSVKENKSGEGEGGEGSTIPEAPKEAKSVAELGGGKVSQAKGKRWRKEITQKADAAGPTSDLYTAYLSPEEKKETASASSVATDTVPTAAGPVEIPAKGPQKTEPDDWEDAADVTPAGPPETSKEPEETHRSIMKYSKDFLLKFADRFTSLPEHFPDPRTDAESLALVVVGLPNAGRPGGPSRSGRTGDDERWNRFSQPEFRPPGQAGNSKSSNARAQQPLLSGPAARTGADADRWQRGGAHRGIIPPPLPAMHRAERKYEVGRVTDEEDAKQRQLKSILNKLTPQNFDKLFEQVKEVRIDNAVTLAGVISQIFDKALTEPTFCEMYANFCSRLSVELPDFGEEREKITFKRLLLNKCQEEFEREEEEASRRGEAGGEENRVNARRRMLGNIRLIGELYKKRMLTERIMHECITNLLGTSRDDPDEENIESLCKLMSTIGEMIDHAKARDYIDSYFDHMAELSCNAALSSRVRFMLKDAIDLRRNKWQQRRKVEGPKKIDEVHRDAAQERHAQQTRTVRGPGPSAPRRVPERGYRAAPARALAPQDARFEPRTAATAAAPLSHRPADETINLVPQGGLGRGMSARPQPPPPDPRRSAPPPDPLALECRMHDLSINAIRQFYSIKDEARIGMCVKELNEPGFHPTMVSVWVTDSFERDDPDRDLLAKLLIGLTSSQSPPILTQLHLIKGFEAALANLEDAMHDAPRAAVYLGKLFGRVVTENVISLRTIGDLINEAGEEPGHLRKSGLAAELMGNALRVIETCKGTSGLKDMTVASGLDLP